MADFLSVQNLKALMEILHGYFADIYRLDITPCDYKRILYRCMVDVSATNPGSTIREKNRITLRQAKEETLGAMNRITYASSSPLPTAHLPPTAPPIATRNEHVRLDAPPMVQLPHISQIVASHQTPHHITDMNDVPLSSEDFSKKLDSLANARDALLERSPNMERLYADATTIKDNSHAHPKDIFAACNADDLGRLLAPEPAGFDGGMSSGALATIAESSMVSVDMPRSFASPSAPKQTAIKYLLINSTDRDWINNKERYSYRVKFTDLIDTKRRVPFYENSPVVPLTRSFGTGGIPNVRGWFYDGHRYDAYDPQQPPGQLVGYETIEITAEPDSHLHNRLKEVVEISVGRVIIPTDSADQAALAMDSSSKYGLSFPYLLLCIDEISGVFDGTNDAARKAFCQLVLTTEQKSANGRGYMVLRPAQAESKVFWPTPNSTLSSLTFSVRRPTGELLNQSRDGIGMLGVHYDTFFHNNIKVILDSYVSKNDLQVGDLIMIKGYTMYPVNETSDQSSIESFNQFINRSEGHEVVQHAETESAGEGGVNGFYIRAPGAYDARRGVFVLDDPMMVELSKFNAFHNTDVEGSNGLILNLSLQHTISLKVTTLVNA
jgi:hypothetical protein